MFNGLIREIGEVINLSGANLEIKANYKPNLGDSIAINGACLSVTKILKNGFVVQLSFETQSKIAIENLKGKVHIEPATKLGERIDGHLIQGHIDAIGVISKINKTGIGSDFFIDLPNEILPLMANKGSVAVEGVSLTINEILPRGIRLTIIPLTLKDSLFGDFKVGRRVNIESDLLARYVARQLAAKGSNLSWDEAQYIASLY